MVLEFDINSVMFLAMF
jgi:hypothetical protein